MMKDVKIKEWFFVKVKKAIFNFDNYENFANEKISKSIKYMLKLILIFAIIITTAYTYKTHELTVDFVSKFKEKVPEFKIENNILVLEGENSNDSEIVISDKSNTIGIIINTQKENVDFSKYNSSIIFLKDKVVFNYSSTAQSKQTYKELTKQIDLSKMSKEKVIEYIDNFNLVKGYSVLFAIVCIAQYIVYLIITLIDLILLSILGFLISKIFKINLRYKQIFNISVYSLTLPIILSIIYMSIILITGFTIKYFQTAYNIISYIYLITAILSIKADVIKIKAEVLTIEKEAEEMKKQKNQEEKEEQTRKRLKKEKTPEKKEESENEEGPINTKKPNKKSNKTGENLEGEGIKA